MIEESYATEANAPLYERRSEGRLNRLGGTVTNRREHLTQSVRESTLAQLTMAMSCVAAAGLLYLAQASQVSVLEYNIADLQAQQSALNVQDANLEATATQLQSFSRVSTLATSQLHMTKADISNAIWVEPVIPPVPQTVNVNADTVAAQEASQPLAWMRQLYTLVRSSL